MPWSAIFPDLSDFGWTSAIAAACIGAALCSVPLTVAAVRTQRRQALRLADALVLRDRIIKNTIVASSEADQRDQWRRLVNDAFAKGDEFWIKDYVEPFYGRAEALKLRESLSSQTG